MTTNTKDTAQNFIIEGANCGSCVAKIEKALNSVQGAQNVEMNFAERTVRVEGKADESTLIKAVENIGYSAKPMSNESDQDHRYTTNSMVFSGYSHASGYGYIR